MVTGRLCEPMIIGTSFFLARTATKLGGTSINPGIPGTFAINEGGLPERSNGLDPDSRSS